MKIKIAPHLLYLNRQKQNNLRELIIDQLVRFLVSCGGTCSSVFKSSTWHVCSYFPEFISGFNGVMLSVVGDVLVDSEAPVVTS
jgi:hypothetical protein